MGIVDQAIGLHEHGKRAGAYRVLGQAGDRCAELAANIVVKIHQVFSRVRSLPIRCLGSIRLFSGRLGHKP